MSCYNKYGSNKVSKTGFRNCLFFLNWLVKTMDENPFSSFFYKSNGTAQSFTGVSSKFFATENHTSEDTDAHEKTVKKLKEEKHGNIKEKVHASQRENGEDPEIVNKQEKITREVAQETQCANYETKKTPNSYDPLWHLSFKLPKEHDDALIREFAFVPQLEKK